MEKQHEGFGKMLSSIQEAIGAMSVKQGEVQETMNKMEKSISSWRPQVDAAVQSLQRDMELLRNQVGAVERHQAEADKSSNTSQALEEREEIARRAPLLPTPPTASMPASTGEIGLDGHRISTQFRGRASGVVTTLVPPPGRVRTLYRFLLVFIQIFRSLLVARRVGDQRGVGTITDCRNWIFPNLMAVILRIGV